MKERTKLEVHLCEGCIKELKNYNPYVDKKGKTIPIKDLNITKVDKRECDNNFE